MTKKVQAGKISGLAIVNAMMFQDILADYNKQQNNFRKLRQILAEQNFRSELIDEWKKILKIDYNPIFKVAYDILNILPSSSEVETTLIQLAKVAVSITEKRTPLRSDLMGQVFHHLLRKPKYAGAFYTYGPAATLLVDLTLPVENNKFAWTDLSKIEKMRISDLACGTGTLLTACIESIRDNYHDRCADERKIPDMITLHRILLEKVLYGFDIFSYCINLSASSMALHYPEVSFSSLNLHSLPLGAQQEIRLGSLDFLRDEKIKIDGNDFTLPELDACIINPPYSRSVGQNLLFGTLEENERKKVQKELRKIVKQNKLKASITVGLGAPFVALADKYLKPDGDLGLVLPKAVLSGILWKKTRDLLSEGYHIRYIISSHERGKWQFTGKQKMAEVLIVSRKLSNNVMNGERETVFVNLRTRPIDKVHASQLAMNIQRTIAADFLDHGIAELPNDMGEMTKMNTKFMNSNLWTYPSFFLHTDLNRACYCLAVKKSLHLPGSKTLYSLPLTNLASIASIGMDRRDIWDASSETKNRTAFPGLHGHQESLMNCMSQKSNIYYLPLGSARKNRKLRDFNAVWDLRGRLMITERFSSKNSLTAVLLDKISIAGVWWSISPKKPIRITNLEAAFEKVLALWLNSTLGLLIFLPSTVITSPNWVSMKKGNLENMVVLDPARITPAKMRSLVKFYDKISSSTLIPINQIDKDRVRALIDAKLQETLQIPGISVLRTLLASEPLMVRK